MYYWTCNKCKNAMLSEEMIELCPTCLSPLEKEQIKEADKEFACKEIVRLVKSQIVDSKKYNCYQYSSTDSVPKFASFSDVDYRVSHIKKTKTYVSSLAVVLDEFSKYMHQTNMLSGTVQHCDIKTAEKNCDKKLMEIAVKHLKLNVNFTPVNLDNLTFEMESKTDEGLVHLGDMLLKLLYEMVLKIHRFCEINNVYGFDFTSIKVSSDLKRNIDNIDSKNPILMTFPDEILKEQIINIQKVIQKNFIVDIFESGESELNELLTSFWDAYYCVHLICSHKEIYKYYDNKISIDTSLEDYIDSLYYVKYGYFHESLKQWCVDAVNLGEHDLYQVYYSIYEYIYGCRDSSGNELTNQKHEGEQKLNNLIGLQTIKDAVTKIKAYSLANQSNPNFNIHMAFYGNPGTGKTEVARIIAEILYENQILPTKKLVEVSRVDLVGQYVGETPHKTKAKIQEAMGGVLFIDEAYSLVPDDASFDYGHEAVSTLIKEMEDKRGKFCVILAGYKNKLTKMIDTNPGFMSRIQFALDFPNYSREELGSIAKLMLEKQKYEYSELVLERILDITDVVRKNPDFSNAREMRNILDKIIMNQNVRALNSKNKVILLEDVESYISSAKIKTAKGSGVQKILTPDDELDALIGLENIKKAVRKIRAYAKKNSSSTSFNLHMCFYGNPGTGKTEVARIMSRLLYEAGVLKEAKVIETDSTGLIGKYMGETGLKTKQLIEDAMGGVLFIDEAYMLTDGANANGYGKEAIATLLKYMEDRRGEFCVILAGYRKEMKCMLSENPGFISRIQFELDFPDYSVDELTQITKHFVNCLDYTIEENAVEHIVNIAKQLKTMPNFANARTIRNILDQVIMNQNLRTENEESNTIIIADVEEYAKEKEIKIEVKEQPKPSLYSYAQMELRMLEGQYTLFDSSRMDQSAISQAVVSISSDDSQGTGVIISSTGLVLSCSHCIVDDGSSQKIRVLVPNGIGGFEKTYHSFEVIYRDESNDIALLKIKRPGFYMFLPLGGRDYSYIPLSQFIMAGYPFGGETYENISFTQGSIASVNNIDQRKVVFADMFGKPGNSGSPVLEAKTNRIIGIFFGGIRGPEAEMIPCFTPLDVLWSFLDSIK